MSLDLYVCAIDLMKFCAVFGTGDRKLFNCITSKRRAEIVSYDNYFLGSEPSVKPIESVIKQIIDGKLDPDTPKFQYEGAAAIIADVIGEPLPVETLREAKAAFCDEVDRVIIAVRDSNRIAARTLPSIGEILLRGPLLKVPLDPKMRLGIGYLTIHEVNRACTALTRANLKRGLEGSHLKWRALTQEGVAEYRKWLTSAVERKRALFLHR